MIYTRDQPSTHIYLVIDGKVNVSRITEDGQQVVTDFYHRDEFFGEAALLNLAPRHEQATALEDTKLMAWTASQIEAILIKQPQLAIALLQMFAQRNTDLLDRIRSFSVELVAVRLARSLISLSDRSGVLQQDGSLQIVGFTDELLSQYVATSREIVTVCMNQFRRQEFLRYSQKRILLYRDAVREWLRRNS